MTQSTPQIVLEKRPPILATVQRGARPKPSGVLNSIGIVRGLAALGVLLYHASHGVFTLTGKLAGVHAVGERLSLLGVTSFFCLSGYLMARLVERESMRRFLLHRVLRIYPAFLAATGLAIAFHAAGLWQMPGFPLVALTLLPIGTVTRPLAVEWTLVYEISYYALVSIFCLPALRRYFAWAILVWGIVVLVSFIGFNQYGTEFQPRTSQIPFSVFNLGFILGALGRVAEVRGWLRRWWPVAGAVFLLTSETFGIPGRGVFLPFGLTLTLIPLIASESRGRPIPAPRTLVLLGDASYGLYLIHHVVVFCVLNVAGSLLVSHPLLSFLIAVAAALMVGIPFGLLDHVAYQRLRSWA